LYFFKLSIILIPLLINIKGTTQKLEDIQKNFSDSLYSNPTYSLDIANEVLTGNIPSEDFALWNKQKGIAYYFLRKYDSAKINYKIALQEYLKLGDTLGAAKNYSNIGVCFEESNNEDSALYYYKKALFILEGTKHDFKGSVLLNLSKIQLNRHLFEKAKRNILSSITTIDVTNEPLLANMYINLGSAYSGLNLRDSAIFFHKAALDIYKKINYGSGIILLENNIANNYNYLNNLDSLFFYASNASIHAKEWSIDIYNQEIDQQLGAFYLKTKDYNKAKTHYNSALNSSKNIQLEYELYQNLSMVETELGNYELANRYLKKYTLIKDSLDNIDLKSKILEIEEEYKTKEKQNKIDFLAKDNELLNKTNKLNLVEIESKNTKITQQRLLYFSILIIAIAIAVIIVVFINRKKIKAEKLQLELANKKLAIEQKLLQSQMNPHFIFNSLNSIQRYVSENDVFNAQIYLARFGKLMRAILIQTRQSEISLEDEIETLNLYIELEQLRFGNKFEVNITCNTELHDGIYIPPMIVQPFIENAILHGFGNIDYKGILTIHFEVNKSQITCTVKDNGIGRKKSKLLQETKQKNHNSLGIQVTKERLESKGKITKSENIIYTDLEQGTLVTIFIPQQNEL